MRHAISPTAQAAERRAWRYRPLPARARSLRNGDRLLRRCQLRGAAAALAQRPALAGLGEPLRRRGPTLYGPQQHGHAERAAVQRNRSVFPKTLYVSDFYERGVAEHPHPLGHIQLVGKLQEPMTRSHAPLAPRWMHRYVTARSIDWRLYSEDLPDPKNRVELTDDDRLRISWTPNNLRSHELLTREARRMARSAGFPITLMRHAGVEDCGHQGGTVRAGGDPEISALDANCRAHDIENLYVVDSSFFPSLPAMNPGLTIAANALRVAAHLRARR
jgi:choline dehydrogenase-like flavoprotein